jgi:dTDP-4-amino-4,6-dideoxygalactose transaminase
MSDPDVRVKRINFARPMLGEPEFAAVREALEKPRLTNGGMVMQFEEAFQGFTGGGRAVAVSSCTAALHLACLRFFGPGDEVIVPALTHVSTAHAVEAVGATPVFVDVSRETGNVTAGKIAEAITERTRGVIVVHYLGRPCNMSEIHALTRMHGLRLIEDCALALGARWGQQHVGLLGDAGCFSFYPAKHITTGEGGMLLTKHPDIAEDAKLRRAFGQRGRHGDVTGLGLNYRMTEMAAAIGLEQMRKLPVFLAKREANYKGIAACLTAADPPLRIVNSGFGAFYGLSVYLPPDVEQEWVLREFLRRKCEFSVYYPSPVPLLTYYREKYGYKAGQFPVSERISQRSICLPVGPHLTRRHVIYIISVVKEVLCVSHSLEEPASSAIMPLPT